MKNWYNFNSIEGLEIDETLISVTEINEALATDLDGVEQVRIVWVFLNQVLNVIHSETRWSGCSTMSALVAKSVQVAVVWEEESNTLLIFKYKYILMNDYQDKSKFH